MYSLSGKIISYEIIFKKPSTGRGNKTKQLLIIEIDKSKIQKDQGNNVVPVIAANGSSAVIQLKVIEDDKSIIEFELDTPLAEFLPTIIGKNLKFWLTKQGKYGPTLNQTQIERIQIC